MFAKWSDTWQLNLAPHKYVVLTLGNISPPIYILNDNLIVDHITDRSISFNNLLSFDMHFINICQKAYALVNQIFRIMHFPIRVHQTLPLQILEIYFLIVIYKFGMISMLVCLSPNLSVNLKLHYHLYHYQI